MLQRFSKVAPFILLVLSVLILWVGLIDANHVNIVQDKQRIEDSIKKATIECYSIEGFYPSNLDYLKEGENIMPNIYVYRKGKDV